MGCICSQTPYNAPNAKYFGRDRICWKYYHQKLGLTDIEIENLYSVFKAFELNSNHQLDFMDICRAYALKVSISKKLLCWCNQSHFSFLEFLVSLWFYCTYSNRNKFHNFLFCLLDDCDTGFINGPKVVEISKLLLGVEKGAQMEHDILRFKDKEGSNQFTLLDFEIWTKSHSSIFNVIFTEQLQLRNQIIGHSYWENLAAKREKFEIDSFSCEYFRSMMKDIKQMKKDSARRLSIFSLGSSFRNRPRVTNQEYVVTNTKLSGKGEDDGGGGGDHLHAPNPTHHPVGHHQSKEGHLKGSGEGSRKSIGEEQQEAKDEGVEGGGGGGQHMSAKKHHAIKGILDVPSAKVVTSGGAEFNVTKFMADEENKKFKVVRQLWRHLSREILPPSNKVSSSPCASDKAKSKGMEASKTADHANNKSAKKSNVVHVEVKAL